MDLCEWSWEVAYQRLMRAITLAFFNRGCIRLEDHFKDDSTGSICLVLPLLGPSVHDFLRNNNQFPFPGEHVQYIGKQLLSALSCE